MFRNRNVRCNDKCGQIGDGNFRRTYTDADADADPYANTEADAYSDTNANTGARANFV